MQASQQLPSWLTLSSTLITEPDGSVSTSFATLRLPLTYYGPSIPLGTDGVWTYGGLTSPPATSPGPTSATPPPSSPSPSDISSTLISSSDLSGSTVSSSAPSSSTTPTSTSSVAAPSPTSSASPIGATSHGISTAVLGAILGGILGAMLLLVIILTICLLRRNTRRRSNPNAERTNTSSFWNRQTPIASLLAPIRPKEGEDRGERRSTPIWTGWEMVDPESGEEGRASIHREGDIDDVPRTPGEGSPRGSGEEADPFLTRRSVRSGTYPDEKARSVSETLVSVPAAAVVSSPPRTGHIISRDVQRRIAEEEDVPSPYDIRVVEPSPYQDHSPLLPPPPLNPDGLGVGSSRRHSGKSMLSQRTQGRSLHSEKSSGSLDADPAELLVARRVRVGELPQSHSRLATVDSEGSSSGTRSALGLSGLGGRLGRLSWFKRSSSGATSNQPDLSIDPYTRTPPRTSRNGSHSRPGSRGQLLGEGNIENAASRRSRHDSGLGFGFLSSAPRPMSSVSAKSHTSASGNTIYYDTRSTPSTPALEFPMPVTSAEGLRRLAQTPADNRMTLSDAYFDVPFNPPPPAYAETSSPPVRAPDGPLEVDILDIPAPPPASPFISSRPGFPPGLIPSPYPRAWRDSYATDNLSPVGSRDSAGITIDIEDEPPVAQGSWRDLAAEREGRRRTFGVQPTVIQPRSAMSSEYPSVHSLRSHLRPRTSRSGSQSAPSSGHSQGGSASSRPSARSQMLSVRSEPSYGSISEGRVDEVGELLSPPLSAVMGSFGSSQQSHPPSTQAPATAAQTTQTYVTPASSRVPLLGGTITSSTTTATDTNSSVTTALTDPITGAVMHLPSLPWVSGRQTLRRIDSWQEPSSEDEEHW